MSASCTRTHTHTAPTGTPQEGARRRATSRPARSPTRGRATLQVADRHTSETSMPRAHPRPQTGGHTGGERAHSRHVRISHACNSARTFRIVLGAGRPNPRGTVPAFQPRHAPTRAIPLHACAPAPRTRCCCAAATNISTCSSASSTQRRRMWPARTQPASRSTDARRLTVELEVPAAATHVEEDGEPTHEGGLVESVRRLAAALVLQLAVQRRPARRSRGRAPPSHRKPDEKRMEALFPGARCTVRDESTPPAREGRPQALDDSCATYVTIGNQRLVHKLQPQHPTGHRVRQRGVSSSRPAHAAARHRDTVAHRPQSELTAPHRGQRADSNSAHAPAAGLSASSSSAPLSLTHHAAHASPSAAATTSQRPSPRPRPVTARRSQLAAHNSPLRAGRWCRWRQSSLSSRRRHAPSATTHSRGGRCAPR